MKPNMKNVKKTTKKAATKTVVAIETKPVAAMPVASKRTTPVKPVKAAAPVKGATTTVTAKPNVTTIEAKIDVGFGNNLFIRGQGAGLSWQEGALLTCVDGQTWRWTGPATEKLTFKLLINDQIWAQGEDVIASPGKKVEVSPRF